MNILLPDDQNGPNHSAVLDDYFSSRVARLDVSRCTGDEVFALLDSLQDHFYEITYLLRKTQFESHSILWMRALAALAGPLAAFKQVFCTLVRPDARPETMPACLKLAKVECEFVDVAIVFASHRPRMLARAVQLVGIGPICDVLDYFCIEGPSAGARVDRLPQAVAGLVGLVGAAASETTGPEISLWFPALARCAHAAYTAGRPDCIAALASPSAHASVISPHVPVDAARAGPIDYLDLVDFYRYTGFCYVHLASAKNAPGPIDEAAARTAHIYLSVLIGLPSLLLTTYREIDMMKIRADDELAGAAAGASAGAPPTLPGISGGPGAPLPPDVVLAPAADLEVLVPVEERQEIAVLFCTNYLLSLQHLGPIILPSRQFSNELQYAVNSLSASLSSDLDKSASKSSQSTPATPSFNKTQFHSFSAILRHGSYKEKLTYVVTLLDKFRLLKFAGVVDSNSESDFSRLISHIDSEQYPGKIAFIQAMHRIVDLVKVLVVKQLVVSGGVNCILQSQLNTLVRCPVSPEIFAVKKMPFAVESHDGVLYFQKRESDDYDEESAVRKLVDVQKLTQELVNVSRVFTTGTEATS